MATYVENNVAMFGEGTLSKCPTCGFPIRPIYKKASGYLQKYEPILAQETWDLRNLEAKPNPRVERLLRKERNGKRTIALVGMAPQSAAQAPFNEQHVELNGPIEIWGLNQMHAFKFVTNWTRWFQMHGGYSWKRDISFARQVQGHYDWLKTDHKKPIYMQFKQPEVPNSTEFPLHDLVDDVFSKTKKGENTVKYFTSTFAFMVGLAILEKPDRIEIYGFEMSEHEEWAEQKACAEFWLGVAVGRGIELYLPERNHLLEGQIYGYETHKIPR